jgi:hypothetical protein
MSSAYFEKLNQEQRLAVEHGVGIAKERHMLRESSRGRRVAERAYERMTMDADFAAVVGNHEPVAGTGEVDMEMI